LGAGGWSGWISGNINSPEAELQMKLLEAPQVLGWQSKIANLKSRIDISGIFR
jgi:hypothetical protein